MKKRPLAAIVEFEGKELHVSPWLGIDQPRIDAFAAATLDRQWIHTDPDRAKAESPYGTTVAHGFLTLSLIPHLMAGFSETVEFSAMINYGLGKVRFPEAVRVNDKVRGRFRLLEARPLKGTMLKLTVEATVEIEGRAKPACVAECILLLRA